MQIYQIKTQTVIIYYNNDYKNLKMIKKIKIKVKVMTFKKWKNLKINY